MTGVYVPTGSLDRWSQARNNAANELVEVLCFGDSTLYGEAPGGVVHPWPYRVRELAAAAGLPDGGLGVSGAIGDHVAPYGVAEAPIKARNGFGGRSIADSWDLLDLQTLQTTTAGDWVEFQGRGTALRLHFTYLGNITPSLTYSVDDGPTVTVNPATATGGDIRTVYVGGLAEGLHTVRVTAVSGDARVIVDWVRSTGIVFHRSGAPGITSAYASRDGRLGTSLGLAGNYGPTVTQGSHPAQRRVRLAIWALGINDQQGGTPVANFAANLDRFITGARNAGADPLIVVPHYEAAVQPERAPEFKAAAMDAATTRGCALVDFGVDGALGPADQWVSEGYVSAMSNPHLTPLGYDTQAAYLWGVLESSQPTTPAGPTVGRWDGGQLQPVTVGRWDGTALQPVTLTVG